jgi:hypothetical protein
VGIAWNAFGWTGTNVTIKPGDGICIVLSPLLAVGQRFGWSVVGTDVNSTQNFTYLDPLIRTNSNWISLPYTSNYTRLSDIVVSIEGGLTGADRDYITGVYFWNATTQQRVGIAWNAFGWTGTNVTIKPGDGICIVLSPLLTIGQQFSWDPTLITSPVPDIHVYD